MTKRERLYPEIKELREEHGLMWWEIGERVGISLKAACAYYNDPTGEKTRARKLKNARQCLDCGKTINTDGRTTNVNLRCCKCAAVLSGANRKTWTPAAIVAAIRLWASEYGEPPAIPDWSPTHARILNDEARAVRHETDDRFPSFMTVIREFGSWNAGIVSAGFEGRAPYGVAGRHRSVRERVAA